jgi:hypothetical protein
MKITKYSENITCSRLYACMKLSQGNSLILLIYVNSKIKFKELYKPFMYFLE